MKQLQRRNKKYRNAETKVQKDGKDYRYYATKAGTDTGIYGVAESRASAKKKATKAKAKVLREWLKGGKQ